MELYQVYRPLTAGPHIAAELPPAPPLAPYICCFWGNGSAPGPALVVPDTCADLIFKISADGAVQAYFCGVSDAPFTAAPAPQQGSTFGIRFYAWAAVLFAEQDMRATKNAGLPAEQYFPALTRGLAARLPYTHTLAQRAALATPLLLQALRPNRTDSLVMRAIGELLARPGLLRTGTLAAAVHISPRQLERLFTAQTGLTPKAAADLIRYQCLWQALRREPALDLKTAAARFGYTDQAHLQNAFKRYHTLTPTQARVAAVGRRCCAASEK